MATPNKKPKQVSQFPAGAIRTWTYQQCTQAINAQTQGDFSQTTYLGRSMMLDGRYRSVVDKRILGLIKSPIRITPASPDNVLEAEAAKLVQDNIKTMLPEVQLIKWLLWYHTLSVGPATLDWTYDDVWIPVMRSLNTEYFRYLITTENFVMTTKDGQLDVDPGDGRWVLMSSWDQGTPSGFVSSLGLLWITKMYAMSDLIDWNAVHASPIIKAITPDGAPDDQRAAFVNAVAAARQTKVIECQQLPDGTGWDVALVENRSGGDKGIMDTITYVDNQTTISVLGANLTTEVVNAGSKAATETHLGIQRELIKADATIAATVIREQILRPFIKANMGDVEPPYLEWLIVGDDVSDADINSDIDDAEATNDAAPDVQPIAPAVGVKPPAAPTPGTPAHAGSQPPTPQETP